MSKLSRWSYDMTGVIFDEEGRRVAYLHYEQQGQHGDNVLQRIVRAVNNTPHTWTRERPTQPGYYWWRRPNHPAALGRVFGTTTGLRFELFPDDEGDIAVSNTWEDTEWYGPLEVPG